MPVEYKSSEQFCNAAKTEYENEFERNTSLDGKVSMTLAFCGAVLFFLIKDREYLDIRSLWRSDALMIFRCLCVLFQFVCLILFGICIFKLFRILMPRTYFRLDTEILLTETLPEWDPKQSYMYLGARYSKLAGENHNANEDRSKIFKDSLKFLLIALLIFCFNEVIKLNF